MAFNKWIAYVKISVKKWIMPFYDLTKRKVHYRYSALKRLLKRRMWYAVRVKSLAHDRRSLPKVRNWRQTTDDKKKG